MVDLSLALGKVAVKPDNISLSTSKADFAVTSQAEQEALFSVKLLKISVIVNRMPLKFMRIIWPGATSENPIHRKFSRHIDFRRYFVCELVKAGFVKLIPLRTHKVLANVLTKSLPSAAFMSHCFEVKCVYFALQIGFCSS